MGKNSAQKRPKEPRKDKAKGIYFHGMYCLKHQKFESRDMWTWQLEAAVFLLLLFLDAAIP